MPDRPPSPAVQTAPDDRLVVTTPQLVEVIDSTLGVSLDEETVEPLLVELDRQEYVEWHTLTPSGAIAWDLTETPDRLADAIAVTVADRLTAWADGE